LARGAVSGRSGKPALGGKWQKFCGISIHTYSTPPANPGKRVAVITHRIQAASGKIIINSPKPFSFATPLFHVQVQFQFHLNLNRSLNICGSEEALTRVSHSTVLVSRARFDADRNLAFPFASLPIPPPSTRPECIEQTCRNDEPLNATITSFSMKASESCLLLHADQFYHRLSPSAQIHLWWLFVKASTLSPALSVNLPRSCFDLQRHSPSYSSDPLSCSSFLSSPHL
jgi:hypothetical protein